MTRPRARARSQGRPVVSSAPTPTRQIVWLDARPLVLAIAGPNGAGKTTFYHVHLAQAGLRFVNADVIGRALGLGAYDAARVAADTREALLAARESFVFETVFSDPVGDKLAFLKRAGAAGCTVGLCFIGVANADTSETRVAMRVSQGGHDVPADKLVSRFPRTLANLARAIRELPHVLVYDNDDLAHPCRWLAEFEGGQLATGTKPWPEWLTAAVKRPT